MKCSPDLVTDIELDIFYSHYRGFNIELLVTFALRSVITLCSVNVKSVCCHKFSQLQAVTPL